MYPNTRLTVQCENTTSANDFVVLYVEIPASLCTGIQNTSIVTPDTPLVLYMLRSHIACILVHKYGNTIFFTYIT